MFFNTPHLPAEEHKCRICGGSSYLIASHLGVCLDCIRQRPDEAQAYIQATHAEVRREFDQPLHPPRTEGGVTCPLCVNECQMGEGEIGYCGLRTVQEGRLVHLAGTAPRGLLHWYRDPLPTNCVGMWTCGGQGQHGMHNLAVFYGSCTVNCLFCQNWHYRDMLPDRSEIKDGVPESLAKRTISAQELAHAANERTFCVCYFGGDPTSQMPHALAASKPLAERGVRVCWETNGTANPKLMRRAVEYSFQSGGLVKFDLKAYDETLHTALAGVPNQRTLANFAHAAGRFSERPQLPLVMASTLLVPGYVDAQEVGRIAAFIAEFDVNIPYALLGFSPSFTMSDLPRTSINHAEEAAAAARASGLKNVRIGNRHLLSRAY